QGCGRLTSAAASSERPTADARGAGTSTASARGCRVRRVASGSTPASWCRRAGCRRGWSTNRANVREAHEVGESVHAVPDVLGRWLSRVGQRLGHRLERAGAALVRVAADAVLDRRHAGRLRAARVLVTVLAGKLVLTRVHAVA